jgi:hypothetical protein
VAKIGVLLGAAMLCSLLDLDLDISSRDLSIVLLSSIAAMSFLPGMLETSPRRSRGDGDES